MKSKTYKILFAILLCAFIVNLIVVFYQYNIIRRFAKTPQFVERMRWENILLKEGFFHAYAYDDTVIDYSVYVSDINGGAMQLQDLLRDRNSLVLFMSVGSCRDCIYDNIEFIKNVKKKHVNVLVGIEGLTTKEFKSFVKQYELEEIAYHLPDNFFSGFEINPVVYFVVDENLKNKYFYSPSIVFPDLTKDYFDVIKRLIDLK